MAKRSKSLDDFPNHANVYRYRCLWCGDVFYTTRDAKYCTDTCRAKFHSHGSIVSHRIYNIERPEVTIALPQSPAWNLKMKQKIEIALKGKMEFKEFEEKILTYPFSGTNRTLDDISFIYLEDFDFLNLMVKLAKEIDLPVNGDTTALEITTLIGLIIYSTYFDCDGYLRET